ncbi:hypothetical protein HK097_001793 [Rhizophlyctis rosea]|uniref:F-box domain-containing protein n=1 Tax=Rhizophlyctis rosea TaxID=64517 RepID=A0AAD5SIV5_9FUNG|nr:hypothetical protein HK097_001793 [Rhizophlyctis rosea]
MKVFVSIALPSPPVPDFNGTTNPPSLAQNLPEVVLDLVMRSMKGVEYKEAEPTRDEERLTGWRTDDDSNYPPAEPFFGPTKSVERRRAAQVCKSWRQAALSIMSYAETIKTYEGVVSYLLQQTHHQFRGFATSNPHSLNMQANCPYPGWGEEMLVSKLIVQCALLTPPVRSLCLLGIKTSTANMMAILAKCQALQHLTIGEQVFGRVDRSSSAVQMAREGVRKLKSLSLQLSISSVQFRMWLLESVGTALLKLDFRSGIYDDIHLPADFADLKKPIKTPAQCTQLRCLIAWIVPTGLEAHSDSLRILVAIQMADQNGAENFKRFLSVAGSRLTGLQLAHKWVDASVLKSVAAHCEILEYVSLSDMGDVAEEGRSAYFHRTFYNRAQDEEQYHSDGFDTLFDSTDVVHLVRACKRLKGSTVEKPIEGYYRLECSHDQNCNLAVALKNEGFGKVWNKAAPGLPFQDMDE